MQLHFDLSPNPSPRRRGEPLSPFPLREGGWGVRSRITYFMQLRTAIDRNTHFSKTHPPMLSFAPTGRFTKHICGNTHLC